jgi:hypothetical protein
MYDVGNTGDAYRDVTPTREHSAHTCGGLSLSEHTSPPFDFSVISHILQEHLKQNKRAKTPTDHQTKSCRVFLFSSPPSFYRMM